MVRDATLDDIAGIVAMTAALLEAAAIPLPMNETVTEAFLRGLVASPLGLVLVAESSEGLTGFLAASIGRASIATLPLAVEHGWWSTGGDGLVLLSAYEQWARDNGCHAARMSTPPRSDRAGRILARRGFDLAEQAWVKVL